MEEDYSQRLLGSLLVSEVRFALLVGIISLKNNFIITCPEVAFSHITLSLVDSVYDPGHAL